MGPVSELNYPEFHCSPLMTRPKDDNKHRVIIDLSYPKGNAVNDFVDRQKFDGTEFTLRFPTIDDIADDIIARAFRNLHVDPADSLKSGIQWQEKLYMDIVITFGWVHSTVAFQLYSDTIAYVMAKDDVKLHCYVSVVPRAWADVAFE